MKYLIFTLLMVLVNAANSQTITSFELDLETPDRGGLVGNGITDLLWSDLNQTLYVGTGFGLSATMNDGEKWQNFTPRDYGGKGGISALAVSGDGTLWIATGYDTLVDDETRLPIGGGLRYLPPNSTDWTFIPQPIDARDDTANGKRPTTTRVQNITFDIAILDTQIWIASFGGGIRRSLDWGETWEVITTDGRPFGALAHLNHRGFSLLAENDSTIWVGTADGISRSTDGGNTWRRFTHTNQNRPISGNFVIALAHNPWDNSVWAATLRAEGATEFNAVSMTRNGGLSWEIHLADELSDGTFVRYFAFKDSAVYVATEKGVYKTIDNGRNWFKIPPLRDSDSGEPLLTSTFYSVATSPAETPFHRVWLGSSDGLATSADNGNNWTIFRSFVSTRQRPEPRVYPSPNPFSPVRSDPMKFRFDTSRTTTARIDIYNFAMEKVITLGPFELVPTGDTFDRFIPWDGLDSNRRMVDNGVYFFRAQIGGEVTWGKVVIIN